MILHPRILSIITDHHICPCCQVPLKLVSSNHYACEKQFVRYGDCPVQFSISAPNNRFEFIRMLLDFTTYEYSISIGYAVSSTQFFINHLDPKTKSITSQSGLVEMNEIPNIKDFSRTAVEQKLKLWACFS